jgi:hypothetical protein
MLVEMITLAESISQSPAHIQWLRESSRVLFVSSIVRKSPLATMAVGHRICYAVGVPSEGKVTNLVENCNACQCSCGVEGNPGPELEAVLSSGYAGR